jgi:hypothetical protein
MAVEFITGRPGGGKSLLAVRMIVEELEFGNRFIATNISLRLPELAEWCNRNSRMSGNLVERVRILTAEETLGFWLHPAPGVDMDPKKKIKWESPEGAVLQVPDLSGYPKRGTLFIIDEAHVMFSSRTYYKYSSGDGFYYLSQHEKFGHSVMLVTQHCENVDKQFRSVTQCYTEVRNGYRDRWPILGGLIKARPGFTSQETPNAPCSANNMVTYTRRWKIDVAKTCSFYDTTAGVGVVSAAGQRAEHGRKGLGLPWYSVIVAAALLGVALWYIPDAVGKGMGSMFSKFTGAAVKQIDTAGGKTAGPRPVVAPPLPVGLSAVPEPSVFSSSSVAKKMSVVREEKEVKLVGWALVPGGTNVYLSDGRKFLVGRDPRFHGFVGPEAVNVEGKIYRRD